MQRQKAFAVQSAKITGVSLRKRNAKPESSDRQRRRDHDTLVRPARDFRLCAIAGQVKSLLRQLDRPPQLALIDLGLPPTPHRPDEGFRLISELIAYSAGIKIVVLSGQSDETNARHARTLGAIEFVAKPAEPETLKNLLKRALEIRDAELGAAADSAFVGKSPPIDKLRQQVAQFADAPFPVLIEGESGSGKELVAKALHLMSGRASRPFLVLNCAAISPNLVEPTLFGYAKGSFTAPPRRGRGISRRQGFDLCLDEIARCRRLQAKLLRVLGTGNKSAWQTQSRCPCPRRRRQTASALGGAPAPIPRGTKHRQCVTIDCPRCASWGRQARALDHFRRVLPSRRGSIRSS